MKLQLRKVRPTDVDLLYEWANDPVVRQNSFHKEPIPYENHVQWFAKVLKDKHIYQYILCEEAADIGQIRLNIEAKDAVISYSISKEYRGKGYGTLLLRLVEEQIKKESIPGVVQLVGLVEYTNPVSARAFEKCDYKKLELHDCIRYERKID